MEFGPGLRLRCEGRDEGVWLWMTGGRGAHEWIRSASMAPLVPLGALSGPRLACMPVAESAPA